MAIRQVGRAGHSRIGLGGFYPFRCIYRSCKRQSIGLRRQRGPDRTCLKRFSLSVPVSFYVGFFVPYSCRNRRGITSRPHRSPRQSKPMSLGPSRFKLGRELSSRKSLWTEPLVESTGLLTQLVDPGWLHELVPNLFRAFESTRTHHENHY